MSKNYGNQHDALPLYFNLRNSSEGQSHQVAIYAPCERFNLSVSLLTMGRLSSKGWSSMIFPRSPVSCRRVLVESLRSGAVKVGILGREGFVKRKLAIYVETQ